MTLELFIVTRTKNSLTASEKYWSRKFVFQILKYDDNDFLA